MECANLWFERPASYAAASFTAVIAGEKVPAGDAQGIEAEIPQALGTKAEELERKARSGRFSGRMRPELGGCQFPLHLSLETERHYSVF